MKTLNAALAVIIWIGGIITGIVLGLAEAESFWLALLYWISAFIFGSIFISFSVILNNQDEMQGRVSAAEAGVKDLRKIIENAFPKKDSVSSNTQASNTAPPANAQLTENGWLCRKCGAENPRGSAICSNCGAYK